MTATINVDRAAAHGAPGTTLGEAVVDAGRRWSADQHDLVRLIAEFDRSGEWKIDRAVTCAHWVAGALDLEVCTAREWLRVGRALEELRVIDLAFETGELSYSKVRTLTRIANVDNEIELCALAQRVPAGQLTRTLSAWRSRKEKPEETHARQQAARSLSTRIDLDGMTAGSFRLPPLEGAALTGAIEAILVQAHTARRDPDASADASAGSNTKRWPSLAQQRADALTELVRSGGATVETEIVVHVRADGLTLDDGSPISDSLVERIAPLSFIRALIVDAERRPINASGRHRHPTDRQRRVVKARDGACVDCGTTEFLQYDHEPAFAQSRRTLVDELRLRCWSCHRARHDRANKSSESRDAPAA